MDDTNIKKFFFPKCVGLKQVEVPNQSFIINGIPQKLVSTVAFCPECGRVIYDFGTNTNEVSATFVCTEHKEELEKLFSYCPQCGQKLFFPEAIEVTDAQESSQPDSTEEQV